MARLNIVSTQPRAGKTCLAGALARHAISMGRRVAYYKPFSPNPEADPDVAFLSRLLEDSDTRQEGANVPPPQSLDSLDRAGGTGGAEVSLADTLVRLEAEFDTVLVEWAAPPVAPESPVLLLHSCADGLNQETTISLLAEESRKYGENLAAVVINNVPLHRRREATEELVPALKRRGIPALGAIPEDREMLALTLGQVADFLGGRWVQEPGDPDQWIDRFLIGGNIMDSGPNYFGRHPHQAVITRAGRPDIQMASLMCDTQFLVLTEGEEPTEYIRVEAGKRNASLLLVDGNTVEVADSLGALVDLATPYSSHKLERFTKLVDENLAGGLEGLIS